MRIDIQRTKFFNELDIEKCKQYFDYTRNKFYDNIDTFYYNIFLKDDDKEMSEHLEGFFSNLDSLKQLLLKDRDTVQEFKGLYVKLGTYGLIYNYRLSEPDMYDIFFTDYLPNKKTARIVVQLRSNALWQYDFKELVRMSFDKVKEVLSGEGVSLQRVLENRIDYCYHTNAIQNPTKFFSDKNLNDSLKTSLKIYHKVGDVESNSLTVDYFSLGQRKSNNVFFRAYNKTREVIELNYKGFFFEHWHRNGMISFYDKYCYEYAYLKKSYNALDRARLEFYLEYGTDSGIKFEIEKLLKCSSTQEDIKSFADRICPKVTLILNIEYQTKRKFYYYGDEQINFLPCSTNDELSRVIRIYENRKLFLDCLTSEVVSFVDRSKGEYKAFWKRLRSLKLKDCNSIDGKYLRKYCNNLDFEKIKQRFINTVATTSIYRGNSGTAFHEDLSSLLGCLNDNDVKFFSADTGELVDGMKYIDVEEYSKYKEKRHKELKNKIRPGRQE